MSSDDADSGVPEQSWLNKMRSKKGAQQGDSKFVDISTLSSALENKTLVARIIQKEAQERGITDKVIRNSSGVLYVTNEFVSALISEGKLQPNRTIVVDDEGNPILDEGKIKDIKMAENLNNRAGLSSKLPNL